MSYLDPTDDWRTPEVDEDETAQQVQNDLAARGAYDDEAEPSS